MTDGNGAAGGLVVRRHKGSLESITRRRPELQEAWDWLAGRRNKI